MLLPRAVVMAPGDSTITAKCTGLCQEVLHSQGLPLLEQGALGRKAATEDHSTNPGTAALS